MSSFHSKLPCNSRHPFRVLRRILQENGYSYEVVDARYDLHGFKLNSNKVTINRDGIWLNLLSGKKTCTRESGRTVTVTVARIKEVYYDWDLNAGEEVLYKVLVDLDVETKH